MTKWEYLIVEIVGNTNDNKWNLLSENGREKTGGYEIYVKERGLEGWEMTGMVQKSQMNDRCKVLVMFKREIERD